MNGYIPWIYVNCYTFLSFLGFFRKRPVLKYENRKARTDAREVVFFNLAERFRIEMREIPVKNGFAKSPFRVKHLLVMAAKTGKYVRVRAVFPEV